MINSEKKLLIPGNRQRPRPPIGGLSRRPLRLRLLIPAMYFLLSTISCATTPLPETPALKGGALIKRDIGEASIMQGDFTAALRELLEAEKLDPNDAITQNYLGIVYKNKKQADKAIFHFKKAVELKPDYSQARNNLGATYLDKESWDEAISCFKELINDLLYATPHFPLSNLGWAYYNKKDYQQAEMYYLKAIEVQPNFIIALNGLGQTFMADGKYPQAIESFEKAAQYGPKIPQIHFQLAKAYEQTGKYDNALMSYAKVIELAPDSDMAREAAKARARIGGAVN